MVNFADYAMPVQYPLGLVKEHNACRNSSALFDVSHMGQVKIHGKDRDTFIERLTCGDLKNCKPNNAYYTLILNEKAGVLDDAIVSKFTDHLHIVINAGNKVKDLEHMKKLKETEFAGKDVTIQYIQDKALVALQGPKSHLALQSLVDVDLSKVYFNNHLLMRCKQIDAELQVCRSGYTGEDGFEISVPANKAEQFCDLLLSNPIVSPAGLGARDTLRLEAGLCLHGNDLDDTTTPAEAALMWTVRKEVTTKFIGYEALEATKKTAPRKRIGFICQEAGILRHGMDVVDGQGNKVGIVSSGTHGPTLAKAVGMAYVNTNVSKLDTELFGVNRGKQIKFKISKMPFLPHRYYKSP